MASIEQDIITWANDRPTWQRVILERVLSGPAIDEAFITSVAEEMVAKTIKAPIKALDIKDLPSSSSTGSKVEIVSIAGVSNVNALLDKQVLDFAIAGLTIIYGDNGSGKSGYARLLKESVGARQKERVLGNAFDGAVESKQSATITFRIDATEVAVEWPTIDRPEVNQVHFYDEACGDDYLVSNTELTYRPSVLNVFDSLILATDQLRAEIDQAVRENKQKALVLTGLNPNTASGKFLSSISDKTTDLLIDEATTLPSKAEELLAVLVTSEARLKSTDQVKEKKRLEGGATLLDSLAEKLDEINALLAPKAGEALAALLAEALRLRKAADLASSSDFASEPLSGVGTETWRALWEAAESYSQAEAYVGIDFPVVSDGAICVLCHQPLDGSAKARLHRFHTFVHDETAKKANAAEKVFREQLEIVTNLEVTTIATTNTLGFLEVEDAELAEKLRQALTTATSAKKRIGERLREETEEPFVTLATVDTAGLRARASSYRTAAAKIDAAQFANQLTKATEEKEGLADKLELAKHGDELKLETERLRRLGSLQTLQQSVTTTPMTTKSNALAREYVTKIVDDRFARESAHLGLNRVILGDQGGDKGKLKHKPALLGATLKGATVNDVLSEGEKTALGLAGLLTEVNFDESKSAVVFDDPVTSLDHGRRQQIAERIAEISAERQVIVFTHDLTFLGDLIRAADEHGITPTERSIVRSNMKVPGEVLKEHPWKAKDAKKRIGDLRERLSQLKKNQGSMSTGDYERDSRLWAGDLSETWERMVRNDVVGKVVDRGTTEVRPRMIKLLAKITEQDNTDFQSGYSQVSKWAPRHDKSEETNFVAPTVEQMELELNRASEWQKRIATYA
jgi:hypothetical protein